MWNVREGAIPAVISSALIATSGALPIYLHWRKQSHIRDEVLPRVRGNPLGCSIATPSNTSLTSCIRSLLSRFEGCVSDDKMRMARVAQLVSSACQIPTNASSPASAEQACGAIVDLLILSDSRDIVLKGEAIPTMETSSTNHHENVCDLVTSTLFLVDILVLGLAAECDVSLLARLASVIEWSASRLAAMQLLFVASGAVEISDSQGSTDADGISFEMARAGDILLRFIASFCPCFSHEKSADEMKPFFSLPISASRECSRAFIFHRCRTSVLAESGRGSLVTLSTFCALSEPIYVRIKNVFPKTSPVFGCHRPDTSFSTISVASLFHNRNVREKIQMDFVFCGNDKATNWARITSEAINFIQAQNRKQARKEIIGRVWGNYTGITIDAPESLPCGKNRRRWLLRPKSRVWRVRCLAAGAVFITAADTMFSAILAAEAVGSLMAFGGGWIFASRIETVRRNAAGSPSQQNVGDAESLSGVSVVFARLIKDIFSTAHSIVGSVAATALTLSFAKVALVCAHQLVMARLSSEIGSEMRYQRRLGMCSLEAGFVHDLESGNGGVPFFHLEAEPSRRAPPLESEEISHSVDESNFLRKTRGNCEVGIALAVAMRSSLGLNAELALINWRAARVDSHAKARNLGTEEPTDSTIPRAHTLGGTSFAINSFATSAGHPQPSLLSRPRNTSESSSLLNSANAGLTGISEHIGNCGSVLAAVSALTLGAYKSHRMCGESSIGRTTTLCATVSAVTVARLLTTVPMMIFAFDTVASSLNRFITGSDAEGLFSRWRQMPNDSQSPSISMLPFPSSRAFCLVSAFTSSIRGQMSFVGNSEWAQLTLKGLADAACRTMNTSNIFTVTAYRGEETEWDIPQFGARFSADEETSSDEEVCSVAGRGTFIGSLDSDSRRGIGSFDPQLPPSVQENSAVASKRECRTPEPCTRLPARLFTVGSTVAELSQSTSAPTGHPAPSHVGLSVFASVLSESESEEPTRRHPAMSIISAPFLKLERPFLRRQSMWLTRTVRFFSDPWRGPNLTDVEKSDTPLKHQQRLPPALPSSSSVYLFEKIILATQLQRCAAKLLSPPPKTSSGSRSTPTAPKKAPSLEGSVTARSLVSGIMNQFLDSEELKALSPPISAKSRSPAQRSRNFVISLSMEAHSLLYSNRHFVTARILGIETYLVMRGLLGKQWIEDAAQLKQYRGMVPSTKMGMLARAFRVFLSHASLNRAKIEEATKVGFFLLSSASLLLALGCLSRPNSKGEDNRRGALEATPLRQVLPIVVLQSVALRSVIHLPYVALRLHGKIHTSVASRLCNVLSVGLSAFEENLFSFQLYRNCPRDGDSGENASPSTPNESTASEDAETKLVFDSNGKICGGFTLHSGIHFRNTSFAYPNTDADQQRNFALSGVHASFPANKMSGIIGPSGSGKSTLVGLLLRESATAAQGPGVFLDDIAIEEFNVDYLRSLMVVVDQSSDLIPGASMAEQISSLSAIAANVHGSQAQQPSLHDIIVASKMANCHRFIMERGGYDFFPPSGAAAPFSSGEIQRIVLARSLLYLQTMSNLRPSASNPPQVIILDEASSRLDALNEERFTSALDKIRQTGKFTIINVSHRMSTLKGADWVVMLEDGHCVGSGTPNELAWQSCCDTQAPPANKFSAYAKLQRI